MVRRPRRWALVSVVALVLPLAVTGPALADPTNNSPAKLTKAVTLDGVLRHLDASSPLRTPTATAPPDVLDTRPR
jgi:aminopeptidase Y